MSTASTATASVELDPTLNDDAVIATPICILITTWDNGTPFDPTSFGQEDAIELCVGLGQEHLEGVLWASDTETVIAFSSSPMMAASQCFAVAMTWNDELVWLHICPPTIVQVRDYIAATSRHPCGTLAPTLGEEVETQPSCSMPYPSDEPLSDLTLDIRELHLD